MTAQEIGSLSEDDMSACASALTGEIAPAPTTLSGEALERTAQHNKTS